MLARIKAPQSPVSLEATAFLEEAVTTFRSSACSSDSTLSFGIDLGTATIVLTATDQQRRPVYWDSLPCQAVRDGVVVNFGDAVAAVKQLKIAAIGNCAPARAARLAEKSRSFGVLAA